MKYQKELDNIPQCPPKDAEAKVTDSFRFVFDPVCIKSFIPQALTQPTRMSATNDPVQKCSLTGLSFFTSDVAAVRVYNNIKMIKKHKKARIGSHLAEGTLDPKDGLQSAVKCEHFDLHPSKNSCLENKFKIVSVL
ncbi:hypothetical protein [Alteromonas sp. OM2203]|uniref:hypothetical protein n=1 Tax=Alteromonas sp. OM2203 TaxID=3398817 RepID=UPI003AF34443